MKVLTDARRSADESLVVGPVSKYVVDKEARDLSRRQDIIHPSEMSHEDWCPRATFNRIRDIREGKPYKKETFGFQTLSIFQNGHEVHDKWQRWLWEMGELWGQWHCLTCDNLWKALAPEFCPECRLRRRKVGQIVYREVPLDAEDEYLIVGSADGAIPKHRSLIEIKTVGPGTVRMENPALLKTHTYKTDGGKSLVDYEGLWRGINRPFPAHQRQGQNYLAICALRGLDYDRMTYIYESKFHQGSKEFVVKRRESIVEPLFESALAIKSALDGSGRVPACPLGGCTRCQGGDNG